MNHNLDPEFELDYCLTCNLGEGSLTTDCYGEPVTGKSDEIYGGKLDYRQGEGWVNKLNPCNQSWLYGKIFNMINKRESNPPKSRAEIQLMFGIDKDQYKEVEKKVLERMLVK